MSLPPVAKLTDFGIAAISETTSTSQMAYALAYSAPETFDAIDSGDSIADPRDERSDQYSLTVTLYALITGALLDGDPASNSSRADLRPRSEPGPLPPGRKRRPPAIALTAIAATVAGAVAIIGNWGPGNEPEQPDRTMTADADPPADEDALSDTVPPPNEDPAVYTDHTDLVLAVTQLSDGRIASTGNDDTVRIWSPYDPDLLSE